jgi:hypothetical protein
LAAASAVALGVVISYLWAGPQYVAGLLWYRHLLSNTGDSLQLVLTVATLIILFLAFFWRRYVNVGAFTFQGLAVAEIQPWYVLWGLPYAALEKRHLPLYLMALPVAAFLMDDSTPPGLQKALFFMVAVVVVVFAWRDVRYKGTTSGPTRAEKQP